MAIRPWARGAFELLVHAETHFRSGGDFDRRIALIGFDNSIEVSIKTFLTLHPSQRGHLAIARERVQAATVNFHTLLRYFYERLTDTGCECRFDESDLIHYHTVRNEQYHGGTLSVPDGRDLQASRDAAIWVFSELFGVNNCEEEIELQLAPPAAEPGIPRSEVYDHLIDEAYSPVSFAFVSYPASQVLYAVDPEAYRDAALNIDLSDPESENASI